MVCTFGPYPLDPHLLPGVGGIHFWAVHWVLCDLPLLIQGLPLFPDSGELIATVSGAAARSRGGSRNWWTAEEVRGVSCMSLEPLASAVDRALVALGELQEVLRAHQESGDPAFELVGETGYLEARASAPGDPEPEPTGSRPVLPAWSSGWEIALRQASVPADFLELDLSPVAPLLIGQRLTTIQGWSPLARLGAAFRRGRGCRAQILNLPGPSFASIPLPWRVSIFIVLCCPNHRRGFWTADSRVYAREVGETQRGRIPEGTIAAAFSTRIEAVAFLLGAETQWPVQLH